MVLILTTDRRRFVKAFEVRDGETARELVGRVRVTVGETDQLFDDRWQELVTALWCSRVAGQPHLDVGGWTVFVCVDG